MANRTQSEHLSLEPPTIKWQESAIKSDHHSNSGSVDDSGFVARQKRRISEHPKITQLQAVRRSSKNNVVVCRRSLSIITSLLLFKIMLVILRLIPVSKIVIYAVYFNKCPVEPMIPLYLVIGGVTSCARDAVTLFSSKYLAKTCLIEYEVSITLLALAYALAEFGWFITGSVYVFLTYGNYQGVDSAKPRYCHSVLYNYSAIVTLISYFLLFLVFSISCCAMCLARYSDNSHSMTHKKEHHVEGGTSSNHNI